MALKLAGYQLGRAVSSETFSAVYNAVEVKSSKTVSVRVFNHTLAANKEFRQQFQKTVLPLVDQTIGIMVPVRRAVIDEQHCCLISDYFHGSTQQIDNTLSLPTDQILQFVQQLASTLEALHSKKLVHGGIEISNIIITEQSQMLLGFMALHKILPSINHISIPSSSIEQAMYLAPEAAQGLSPATDFYALGVLLFQLLNKQNPFDAANVQQLEQQQRSFRLRLPKSSLNRLKPLFTQLLHPDPEKRICSAQRLHQAIEASGYTIMRPVYSIHSSPVSKPDIPAISENKSAPPSKQEKKLLASILATLALTVIAFVIWSGSNQQNSTPGEPELNITKTETKSPRQTPEDELAFAINRAESLYQEALKNVEQGNYGSALINCNNALKENQDHQPAIQLKAEIEMELEARALILHAENQFLQNKMTAPPGDNALETYNKLALLLPEQDKRAQQGIVKIAVYFYGLANIEFSSNNDDTSLAHIRTGLSVLADYGPLLEIQQAIRERQQRLARKRQQERIKAAKARKQRERKLQQEQLELKRQQELAAQQLAVVPQLQVEYMEINPLLEDANHNLRLNELTLSSITTAKTIYIRLTEMDLKDSRITGLKEDIIDAYEILATSQKNSSQLNTALITIKQGLLMDKKNENLSMIKNEITALIARQKKSSAEIPGRSSKSSKPVPVIGIF